MGQLQFNEKTIFKFRHRITNMVVIYERFKGKYYLIRTGRATQAHEVEWRDIQTKIASYDWETIGIAKKQVKIQ